MSDVSLPAPPRKKMTRRKFIGRALATCMGTCAKSGLYAWRIEPHWIQITEHQMKLRGLPDNWAGRKLVQISDLHAGDVVSDQYLRQSLARVNDIKPDVLAITGDFMTCGGTEQIDRVVDIFKSLHTPPHGAFACLGNHDYTGTWRNHHVADTLVARLEPRGIRFLRNERADVSGLQLLGVDELWAMRCEPKCALRSYDTHRAAIALIHNPDIVDMAEWAPFDGWFLAGHTHGGQVDPPFMAPPLLPVRNRSHYSGRYAIGPNQTLYVNRGVGYSRRVRFNARPEIAVFTLGPA